MNHKDLKEFLDEKLSRFNNSFFIKDDPISVPHLFFIKEDIEIAAFIASTLAWGQRPTIISNSHKFLRIMGYKPFEFLSSASKKDMEGFKHFTHRTFNGVDAVYFVKSLKNIYANYGGLEKVFFPENIKHHEIKNSLIRFRKVFFNGALPGRTGKHIADIEKKASAKRLNMFLRWMVRKDGMGVDFGLWKSASPSILYCPLDIHSGTIARKLGLLHRKQNDWQAVEELTASLRKLDAKDPIKYDIALFGLGAIEKF
jgi:uncharacterized protein (TIGR02757 family)